MRGSIAGVVVVAAWAARMAVEQELVLGDSVSLLGALLRLTRGENSGVAFGLLRGSSLVPWLSAIALIALAILIAHQQSRLTSVAWGLILGGGLANLIDRFADGRVTDYIDVTLGAWHYPTFNLPDVAITVGFIILLGMLVLSGNQEPADAEHDNREKSAYERNT